MVEEISVVYSLNRGKVLRAPNNLSEGEITMLLPGKDTVFSQRNNEGYEHLETEIRTGSGMKTKILRYRVLNRR